MKKIIVLLLICFLLTGCTLRSNSIKEYNLSGYGKYSVPRNAVLRKDHSNYRKLFFVKSIDKNNSMPNNISVEGGTNKYSKEEHELFKKAILNQLYMQSSRHSGAQITASGSKTKNGDILYTFNMKDSNTLTRQYYIVGDYKYVLVHETILNGEEDRALDNMAKYIINTFRWE